MICFRDMSFCVAKCATTPCVRKLTDEVRADAERWWLGFNNEPGAPIDQCDWSERCAEYQPLTEEA